MSCLVPKPSSCSMLKQFKFFERLFHISFLNFLCCLNPIEVQGEKEKERAITGAEVIDAHKRIKLIEFVNLTTVCTMY